MLRDPFAEVGGVANKPRFVKRTIVTAVAGLVLVTAFVDLAFWQLRRNHEKRTYNATLLSRAALPPLDIGDAWEVGTGELAYRHAAASGTYDTTQEIVLTNHSLRGIAGHHVLTPLVLEDGRALLVDRGWVPLQNGEPPVRVASPPAGSMRVDGVLVPSQVRRRFGPKLPATGVLRQAFRADIPRLSKQLPYAVFPLWLHLRAQDPPQPGAFPRLVPLPTRDAGPHLSYAIQYFVFALVAIIGAAVLEIRRRTGVRAAREQTAK